MESVFYVYLYFLSLFYFLILLGLKLRFSLVKQCLFDLFQGDKNLTH